jgi:REP element-mobilizing transposase RayT
MRLNEYGQVAHNEWLKLQDRFNRMEMDVFQIMPNHMHAIVSLSASVGAALAAARNDETNPSVHDQRAGASPAPTESFDDTLGDIVGAYKSLVANGCLKSFKLKHTRKGINPASIPPMGRIWQRNYYDHIIRNTTAYLRKAEYIKSNPANWEEDEFHQLD